MAKKKKLWFVVLPAVLFAVGVAGWFFLTGGHPADAPLPEHDLVPVGSGQGEVEYWTCTMHPSVKMNDPGKCPICSMDLVPVNRPTAETGAEAVPTGEGEIEYWTCTMHPSVKMSGPGNCPICSMDLVPGRMPAAGESVPAEQTEAPQPDRSVFTVEAVRQQLIGVRTQPVATRTMEADISTIGVVELDETRITHVHTKYSGWISKVFVNYTWQHVKKGEPLFSVYSPDVVATQEEYLLALQAEKRLGSHPLEEVAAGAESLLAAAKKRLLLWDITEQQIDDLENTGQAQNELIFYSPVEGHVTYRNAFENMRVEPGTKIYTVADHSRVWVNVEVYETDISFVRLGQRTVMTVDAYPGDQYSGEVTYIWPHLSEATRTMKVRLEFPNPDLRLKPGMYAQVKLRVPGRRVTAIPASAVLRTGERDIVFVDRGGGRMQARLIQLGRRAGDYYEVTRGLRLGEEIVVAGNFLIDAESQVQGAIANWGETEP